MPTTTNYGWTTPADTDLVKDGASAIRTLGDGVDTTVKALNPETTLGDISYRSSTANTNTRLAIGSSGQVLTVSGGVPTWATASSGAFTLLSTTTLSGSSTTITVSDTTYRHLFVDVSKVNPSANFHFFLGVNGGTTNHWTTTVQQWNGANNAVVVGAGASKFNVNSGTRFMKSGNTDNAFAIWIFEYTSTATKNITCNGNFIEDSATSVFTVDTSGVCTDTATVSSLVFTCSTGTMSGGTVKVYGVK